MAKARGSDARLARVQAICQAFPEAACAAYGDHQRFHVRDKTFAYYLDDHHGDGRVCATFKVAKGENLQLVRVAPQRFYLPAYLARSGWISYQLDTGPIDWDELTDFLRDSYLMQAPTALAAQLRASARA